MLDCELETGEGVPILIGDLELGEPGKHLNSAGRKILQHIRARVLVLYPVEVVIIEEIAALAVGNGRRLHDVAHDGMVTDSFGVAHRDRLFFELLAVGEKLECNFLNRRDFTLVDPRLHG